MPRLVVARTAPEVEELCGLWKSLYQPGRQTLFQSFEWNLLAARVFRSEQPYVIAVETGTGAAILPACVADGCAALLGETLFDYRDFLTRGDEDVAAMACGVLVGLGLPLQITALCGEEAANRWRSMGLSAEPFVIAPGVRLAGSDADTFVARHHRSARLLRRLTRAGATFHEHSGTDSALVRRIYDLKARQVLNASDNLFADPVRREFMVAAAALSSCDVFTLESAGTLVAALVTFRDGDVRRFYTTYYDHAWAHSSPGIALLFEVTRRSLEQGLHCDYMTGEQPHKMRFADSFVPLYRMNASASQLAHAADATKMVAA